MPSVSEKNEIYRGLFIKDNYGRSRLNAFTAKLNAIFMTAEFKEAMGVKTVEKRTKRGKDERVEQGPKEYDELINSLVQFEESISVSDADKRRNSIDGAYAISALFKMTDKNGVRVYDKVKKAAPAAGIKLNDLYDDLYYFDDKLSIGKEKWIDMPSLDPGTIVKKKKLSGEPSWANYTESHLTDIPHSPKKKQEYLAKAMIGAYKDWQNKNRPKDATKFSVREARSAAEKLMQNPSFKSLCKDPGRVKSLLEKSSPEELADVAIQMYRPFYKTSEEDRISILRNVKTMSMLMAPAEDGDSSWKSLHKKINSINLDDPKACDEKKLQEVFACAADYMKGKKSLRKSPRDQMMFDQALDIASAFSRGGEYAKITVEAIFDRINEVRLGHDKSYKKIKMTSYGTSGIQKHTMKGSRDISAYKDRMRYPDGKPEVNKYDRKVFEPYPQMDQTQLYDWKYTDKDKPLRMNTEVFRLNSFVNASGELSPEDSTKAIAKILALSETQMFYMDKKRVMSYFQGRENGKRVESSLVVISKNEYDAKLKQYMADPAVAELGKKYSDPALRAGLTTTTAHENEALSENHIVEPRDPYTLDVKRLRSEYAAVKNKTIDFGAPLVRSVLYNIPNQ